MKQQINLYLPELQQRSDWLDTARMGKLLLAAAAVLAALSGWRAWGLLQIQQELEDAHRAAAVVSRQTEQLAEELGRRSEDQSLAARVRELEDSLRNKRVLLAFLDTGIRGNTAGFSGHLADLSRYLVADLQLVRISLRDGGEQLRLGGNVLQPESVPLYLQNLRQGSSYQGISFEALRIEEDQATELLQFNVASRASGD